MIVDVYHEFLLNFTENSEHVLSIIGIILWPIRSPILIWKIDLN